MTFRIVLRAGPGTPPPPAMPEPHPIFETTRRALDARRRELDREADALLAAKERELAALIASCPSPPW